MSGRNLNKMVGTLFQKIKIKKSFIKNGTSGKSKYHLPLFPVFQLCYNPHHILTDQFVQKILCSGLREFQNGYNSAKLENQHDHNYYTNKRKWKSVLPESQERKQLNQFS